MAWVVILFNGCAHLLVEPPPVCKMVELRDDSLVPRFGDDASASSLRKALSESISFWRGQDPNQQISVCDQMYSSGRLLDSLLEFQKLLRTLSGKELSLSVAQQFKVYQARNSGGGGKILVTGYYQPVLQGSLIRKPPYIYPVYHLPIDLIKARRFDAHGVSKPVVGRLENGRFLPYWRRSEIDNNKKLAGQELFYVRDPVDAFVLHVQGSGLVRLLDGTLRQVMYAGSNGWPYKSIGRLLVDEGRMALSEVSMPKIRQYLLSHLDERRRILHYNDRYIFFRMTSVSVGQGPVGSMGHHLTPGRSVALDTSCFPMGALCYLATELPRAAGGGAVGKEVLKRFVLAQDSGAAINGSGRLDLFWGHGHKAALMAGYMRQPGELYLLIKKDR